MPSRVVTKRRSKIARLFFRKKRNNNTRRIVKHRRYDKIPKTKRPIYSGGGSLSVKSGDVGETIYHLVKVPHTENYTGRMNPAVIRNNAFSIELSRGTLSAAFGGNHTLKIEIDMSKYKHATIELVTQLFFEIFGVPIPTTFDFTGLVDLDHVLDNFDNLNKGAARNVGCYRMWNKLTIDPTDPEKDPTPIPRTKCVVTFEFKIKAGGTIEFNSISFTAIVPKITKCLDVNNEIDVELPGYDTITKKTPGTSISTSLLTSDHVSEKIGQLPTTFNVCVVPKSKARVQTFCGFNDLMTRPEVQAAVETFKNVWMSAS